jgi:hypothetical protein
MLLGFEAFIHKHLSSELNMESSDMSSILNAKELIVSLNKRDLLDSGQLNDLDSMISKTDKTALGKKVSVNMISCLNPYDLDALLNQLKSKIENL